MGLLPIPGKTVLVMRWDELEFANAWAFYLLLFLPLLGFWYVMRNKERMPGVRFSGYTWVRGISTGIMDLMVHVPYFLRLIAIGLLIVAFARPQTSSSWEDVTTEGIDIVMALDVSASMLARDFDPNRLEVAKDVGASFIKNRPNDRIGLVVYEGKAFTQCPLTTDHRVLLDLFSETRTGMIKSGTAIGMGLATSVNRLKESDAESKVVILLSDGVNNRGSITPRTAARIAENFGVRVYTIGVGSEGKAPFPVKKAPNGQYVFKRKEVEIDEETLREIAELTGGKYFRATDRDRLKSIYEEIDRLEKTRIEVTEHRKKTEQFYAFALVGGGLLLLEFLLRYTVLRTTP